MCKGINCSLVLDEDNLNIEAGYHVDFTSILCCVIV